ncbi:hypothetical protein PVAP13_4NG166111 [Panicum virgatum]|uniref:Uncharacterized protein n=1 Tax=Panicum virgatum TaxID=38727 RepID=A0A8T0T890_PANVG|nr:hypothetical protein PVAP13_4NG166111 [Panicum virgatum]
MLWCHADKPFRKLNVFSPFLHSYLSPLLSSPRSFDRRHKGCPTALVLRSLSPSCPSPILPSLPPVLPPLLPSLPARAGPLPIQTGFLTSIADLIIKNHVRLKKLKRRHHPPRPETNKRELDLCTHGLVFRIWEVESPAETPKRSCTVSDGERGLLHLGC